MSVKAQICADADYADSKYNYKSQNKAEYYKGFNMSNNYSSLPTDSVNIFEILRLKKYESRTDFYYPPSVLKATNMFIMPACDRNSYIKESYLIKIEETNIQNN